MRHFLCCILGYLIGALPFAVIISRLVKGINIMEVGSKNPGAANVLREVGKVWGALVWLFDTAKGAIAMLISAKWLTGNWILNTREALPIDCFFIGLSGICAICGHCRSIFLKFKGGKGVSTIGGMFLYIMPKIFPIAVIAYFLGQKRRVPFVMWTICAAVFALLIWIYWAQKLWIIPFFIIFIIVGVILNISTIKEIKENVALGKKNV